ncbi:MAG: hypothetical protein AAGA48_03595 [Myxococcota bacterium]
MRPLFILSFAIGCLPFGVGGTSTTTDSDATELTTWAGFGPMTLGVAGDEVMEQVFATAGGDLGVDDPPVATVVRDEMAEADRLVDGREFTNLSLRFDTDQEAIFDAWREGRDLVDLQGVFGMLLTGPDGGRGVGGASSGYRCRVDFEHRERLPDNPFSPDTLNQRYGVTVACMDAPWEDIGTIDPGEGVYATIDAQYDSFVIVGR